MSNADLPPRTLRLACTYVARAMVLKCPQCGVSPMFPALRQTRSLFDWFLPLDGCPRCGYPYTREQGYYLMATWAFSYGFSAIFGIVIYVLLEIFADLTTWHLIEVVVVPTALFGFFTARHGKSLFLALDLFFDPAVKAPSPRKILSEESDSEF
jgi:uncharacterized protein (DUF983 family)